MGKSFALNHLVDTSFAGSAMRTTEGVWMSVTPTDDTLIVALDFEGDVLSYGREEGDSSARQVCTVSSAPHKRIVFLSYSIQRCQTWYVPFPFQLRSLIVFGGILGPLQEQLCLVQRYHRSFSVISIVINCP